jgi:hypothetical protein
MKNAEKFKEIFKEFATEVWAFPEKDFLTWLNAEYKEPTTKNDLGVDCINRQAVIDLMMQKWGENFSGDDAMQESIDAIRVMPSVTPQLSVPEVTALAEWTEKLTKASEDAYNKGYADGMKAQESRWIPVSERLPEEHICDDGYHEPSKSVLVQMKSGEMHTARYWSRYDERWLDLNYPTTDEVIAWMPLPKAYREVEE